MYQRKVSILSKNVKKITIYDDLALTSEIKILPPGLTFK